jgi:hypothetical protein
VSFIRQRHASKKSINTTSRKELKTMVGFNFYGRVRLSTASAISSDDSLKTATKNHISTGLKKTLNPKST